MKRQLRCLLLVMVSWVSTQAVANQPSAVSVVASIRPLALIAQEILQPVANAQVETLVSKSASPHGFSLKPSQLKAMLNAPLVIWLGPSFEPSLSKAIAKRGEKAVISIEVLSGVELLPAREVNEMGSHDLESHDEHHGHHHDVGLDPHLWWSAENALVIAADIAKQLSTAYPEHTTAVEKGLQVFQDKLHVNKQLLMQQIMGKPKAADFFVYHDSLFYLEHELGLYSLRRVAVSPDAKPSIKDMLSLKMLIDNGSVGCVVMEPNASGKFLQKVNRQQRAKVIEIDPLGWNVKSYSSMWLEGAKSVVECSY